MYKDTTDITEDVDMLRSMINSPSFEDTGEKININSQLKDNIDDNINHENISSPSREDLSILEQYMMNNSKSNIEDHCLYCGDTGRTKENPWYCEHCGRKYKELNGTSEVTMSELQGIYIPKRYRNKKFNINDIIDNIKLEYPLLNMKTIYIWLESLDTIVNKVVNKDLNHSQIIVSCISKLDYIMYSWVYFLLESSLRVGYSTTHLLNLVTINPKTFDSMYCDILFLELSEYCLKESMYKLDYICSVRNNFDLPTIIITKVDSMRINSTGIEVTVKNGLFRLFQSM